MSLASLLSASPQAHSVVSRENETEPAPASAPWRRRGSRACDKCSFSRTRCNGGCPCGRCRDHGFHCSYTREVKRRGRKRKESQQNGDIPNATRSSNNASENTLASVLNGPHYENDNNRAAFASSQTPIESLGQSSRYTDRFDSTGSTISGSAPSFTARHSRGSVSLNVYPSAPIQHAPAIAPPPTDPFHLRSHQYLRTDSSAEASQPRHGAIYFGSPTSERLSETNGELPTVATTSITTPSSSDPPTAIASSTAHRSNFEPCKYPVLIPLLPILANIIPVSVACDLLRLYFDRPGSSMLKCASPYVLTHVLRRRALLHPSHPRVTSPALILAMLHATAHTADLDCFHVPGSRAAACDKLYVAAIEQLNDCERWHRLPSGRWVVPDGLSKHNNAEASTGSTERDKYEVNDQCSSSDDLLAMILVTIVISGGTFKADCLRWWGKALRLARVLQLAGLDKESRVESKSQTFFEFEAAEERRRIFWLLFCLDRHLALSYNAPLAILDSDVSVYLPLPETTWNDPDLPNLPIPNGRVYGPRTTISGTGFFEFFLPLMTILGDIVLLHHRRLHPRLSALSDAAETAAVESLLRECEQSLAELRNNAASGDAHSGKKTTPHTSSQLVAAYSTHILHVLSVLLYGKWDPITMLTATPASFINSPSMGEDSDDWITPDRFMKCTSHAVAASQAVDAIITLDPELVFMPYLFGIYLLQGSFILLLFADRMPQLGGPNPEVEMACETIIRAHEICVVTLTTEFQRSFRRVLRSTLYSVRNAAPCDPEEAQARRNALAMYRWTRGGRGLAL